MIILSRACRRVEVKTDVFFLNCVCVCEKVQTFFFLQFQQDRYNTIRFWIGAARDAQARRLTGAFTTKTAFSFVYLHFNYRHRPI